MALSDADVKKIVDALKADSHALECRFKDVSPEDLRASVEFYKHANRILTESSSTVRNTILGALVLAMVALIWAGFLGKLKIVGGP